MTSVRRRFNRQPLRGNGPACLCQVSTPDALIERKAIAEAPFILGLAIVLNETLPRRQRQVLCGDFPWRLTLALRAALSFDIPLL